MLKHRLMYVEAVRSLDDLNTFALSKFVHAIDNSNILRAPVDLSFGPSI